MRPLIQTRFDVSLLFARLALGAVMLPHGAQKLLGWFGGHGFDATMKHFTETMGIPAVLAFLVIAAESFGALGLVVGLLSRVAALGIGAVMAVAITVHRPNGFFMNWSGSLEGEGYEYHILALGLSLAVLIGGSGAFSLDRALLARSGRS